MRTTGFGLSALLVSVGAILASAVTVQTDVIDIRLVGVILFAVGVSLALITLIVTVLASPRMNRRPAARRDGQDPIQAPR